MSTFTRFIVGAVVVPAFLAAWPVGSSPSRVPGTRSVRLEAASGHQTPRNALHVAQSKLR